MKNVIFKSFIIFCVYCLCCSCCTLHKVVTKTRQEQILKIDTFFIFRHDTVPIYKFGTVHDTLKIENSTARAVAYFDVIKNKYVLMLQGKPFEVHFQINKRVITLTEQKTIDRKSNKLELILFILILCFVAFGAYKLLKK